MAEDNGMPEGYDIIQKSKELAFEIKAKQAQYVSGELDLNDTLKKTDALYKKAIENDGDTSAERVLQDSDLIHLQTEIARLSVKSVKVDDLSFDPRTFSLKMRDLYAPRIAILEREDKKPTAEMYMDIWTEYAKFAVPKFNMVPHFDFMYGTFDADSVPQVKLKRKRQAKDKIASVSKPEEVKVVQNQDLLTAQALQAYADFNRVKERFRNKTCPFWLLVTDPNSFTRTTQNIFTISALVKLNWISIFNGPQGIPFIRDIPADERKNEGQDARLEQNVVSLTHDDWEEIVKNYKITKAEIKEVRSAK